MRKEDDRFLRGRGQYVPDMRLSGQQEVAFLRSPVARARIRSITKPPGQEANVFVAADLVGMDPMVAPSTIPTYRTTEQYALAKDEITYVGEPIAMCVAPTRAAAEDLAEQVVVDLDELPVISEMKQARYDNSVRVHNEWPDNHFVTVKFERDFDKHSAGAPVVVSIKAATARQAIVPMEGKAVLAYWDDRLNQLVVYSATQVPHVIRAGISLFLNIEHQNVRVIAPDVGGGFGYKCWLQPEELCVAWLGMKFRRPFRYVEDMRENLIIGASCREHEYSITGYASREGRLLAVEADVTINGGAYSSWPWTIGVEAGQATYNLPGPYDFWGYRCETHCVATNRPPLLTYRGVARTSICFAMELLIDSIARKIGKEPWEVRCLNYVTATAMPYNSVTNKHYDSGDYKKSLLMAKDKINFDAIRTRQRTAEPDGRLIGVGFATYCEQSATGGNVYRGWGLPLVPGYEQASVRVTPDGGLEIRVGIQSHGQGMETTLGQIANQVLGIGLDRIQVTHGDTGLTPYSTGTYASRSIVMAGGAVAEACENLVPRFLKIGAHLLQCKLEDARFDKGAVVGPGGATASVKSIAEAWYIQQSLPDEVDTAGLESVASFRCFRDSGAQSYATHAAVIAVDVKLGQVEILDYVIVEDCGTQVNPMVVEGQTAGGAAQGVGTAMYEETQYDANGQPKASTLADYLLPGATETPAFRIFHTETPSPYTKFGIKGMGEGGAIAPPAAIFNAVNDALRDLGVELNSTPLTPAKLLEAIHGAETRKGVAA